MAAGVLLQGSSGNGNRLTVAGTAITRHVPTDLAPIRWSDSAGAAVGTLDFTVEDPTSLSRLAMPGGADVHLIVDGTRVWGGTLIRRRITRGARGRIIECSAVSYESWLDWRIIPRWSSRTNAGGRIRKLATDRAMVKDVIERRGGPLLAPSATVDETNT